MTPLRYEPESFYRLCGCSDFISNCNYPPNEKLLFANVESLLQWLLFFIDPYLSGSGCIPALVEVVVPPFQWKWLYPCFTGSESGCIPALLEVVVSPFF